MMVQYTKWRTCCSIGIRVTSIVLVRISSDLIPSVDNELIVPGEAGYPWIRDRWSMVVCPSSVPWKWKLWFREHVQLPRSFSWLSQYVIIYRLSPEYKSETTTLEKTGKSSWTGDLALRLVAGSGRKGQMHSEGCRFEPHYRGVFFWYGPLASLLPQISSGLRNTMVKIIEVPTSEWLGSSCQRSTSLFSLRLAEFSAADV